MRFFGDPPLDLGDVSLDSLERERFALVRACVGREFSVSVWRCIPFTIVLQSQVPWQTALGMVFWAGVLFLVVSTTPLREHIALAIPPVLRSAAAAGIGLLLTFIGLRNAGLIVGDPATLVRMGTLDHRAAFLLLGILIAVALMRRHNPLAFRAAILAVTALAWTLG